jgi:hypothetical protein
LVLSVRNAAHKDLALKMLVGRWNVTEDHMFDHKRVALYTYHQLSSLMDAIGWREAAERDWLQDHTDQFTLSSTSILNDRTPIGRFLCDFARQTNPYAVVSEFVRLYRAGEHRSSSFFVDRSELEASKPYGTGYPKNSPFLSVVIRTTGTRTLTLQETLMSLTGQTCQDFEVILVVHSTGQVMVKVVNQLVADFPLSMRNRIQVVRCDRPGRSAPLNDAIKRARGRYIATLDDDDRVFAHWVETFQIISSSSPGQLIRATCARQEFEITASRDLGSYARAVSWFLLSWPSTYDLVAHLLSNDTPNMSVAFPLEVFREDALQFDETLETTEDWDLTIRAALRRGVVSTPEITAIYRWWTNGEATRFFHALEQRENAIFRIRSKLDAQVILLPPGSVSRLSSLVEEQRTRVLEHEEDITKRDNRIYELEQEIANRDNRLLEIVNSTSWRVTKPLRVAAKHMSMGQLQLLRRVKKLCYWSLTPHRIPAKLRFMKRTRKSARSP